MRTAVYKVALLPLALAVNVCTNSVVITKARSSWGAKPETEPWNNVKAVRDHRPIS